MSYKIIRIIIRHADNYASFRVYANKKALYYLNIQKKYIPKEEHVIYDNYYSILNKLRMKYCN